MSWEEGVGRHDLGLRLYQSYGAGGSPGDLARRPDRPQTPRIYSILKEINRRFCEDLWKRFPGDWDKISRMAIISYNVVKMANLSVYGSHCVNGVS